MVREMGLEPIYLKVRDFLTTLYYYSHLTVL
nr:MAG TPA: hypothetical protein [Caudoviricetes sp.]